MPERPPALVGPAMMPLSAVNPPDAIPVVEVDVAESGAAAQRPHDSRAAQRTPKQKAKRPQGQRQQTRPRPPQPVAPQARPTVQTQAQPQAPVRTQSRVQAPPPAPASAPPSQQQAGAWSAPPPPSGPRAGTRPASGAAPRKRSRAGAGWIVAAVIVGSVVWGVAHDDSSNDDDHSSQTVTVDPGDPYSQAPLIDPDVPSDVASELATIPSDDGAGDDDSDTFVPHLTGAHTLVFEVGGGTKDIDVDYAVGDQSGYAYYTGAPWNQKLSYDGTSSVDLDVVVYDEPSDPATCTILVDGATVVTETASAEDTEVSCSYEPAG